VVPVGEHRCEACGADSLAGCGCGHWRSILDEEHPPDDDDGDAAELGGEGGFA
jgi:hypothetical protein